MKQSVDQVLAEGAARGDLRAGDKNDGYQFTTKGAVRMAVIALISLIEEADRDRRDLTSKEKGEVSLHIRNIQESLGK